LNWKPLSHALAIGLIVALTMPAGVVVVASALGIVEW